MPPLYESPFVTPVCDEANFSLPFAGRGWGGGIRPVATLPSSLPSATKQISPSPLRGGVGEGVSGVGVREPLPVSELNGLR